MKKALTIGIMVLVVVLMLLYVSQEKETPDLPVTDKRSNGQTYDLKMYEDRFARNNYHLEKALESINST